MHPSVRWADERKMTGWRGYSAAASWCRPAQADVGLASAGDEELLAGGRAFRIPGEQSPLLMGADLVLARRVGTSGASGTRTHGLRYAIPALSQLSYSPKGSIVGANRPPDVRITRLPSVVPEHTKPNRTGSRRRGGGTARASARSTFRTNHTDAASKPPSSRRAAFVVGRPLEASPLRFHVAVNVAKALRDRVESPRPRRVRHDQVHEARP